jgi:hypothetical protein
MYHEQCSLFSLTQEIHEHYNSNIEESICRKSESLLELDEEINITDDESNADLVKENVGLIETLSPIDSFQKNSSLFDNLTISPQKINVIDIDFDENEESENEQELGEDEDSEELLKS